MPVNQLIAQGFQPVGRDLPQVGNMLMQRDLEYRQDARRNELLAIEQAQNARAAEQHGNAMRASAEQQGWAREDRARTDAERELNRIYPLIKAGDPEATRFALEGIARANPEAARIIGGNPEKLAEVIGGMLGKPGPLQSQQMSGYGTVVTQDGKYVAGRPTPSYAPHYAPDPSYETFTEKDGTLWERDRTGQKPVRPVMTPGGRHLSEMPKQTSGGNWWEQPDYGMGAPAAPAQQAPPEALRYLQQNPQFAPQFQEKYGYLPTGF